MHISKGNGVILKVTGVRAMDDHMLLLEFSTGEARIFDLKPLLSTPAFAPLKDRAVFNNVYLDHGVTAWSDEIDIAPEYLYEHSVPAEQH